MTNFHQAALPPGWHLADEAILPGGRTVTGTAARVYNLLAETGRHSHRWKVGRHLALERAAHPEPSSPLPLRGGGARGGGATKTRNPVLLAGSDETRRQLALQIIEKQGGKK